MAAAKPLKTPASFTAQRRGKMVFKPTVVPVKRRLIKNTTSVTHGAITAARENTASEIGNWLYEYLRTKQCAWEGCTVNDPDMLVFDHLNPREKRAHVTTMAHNSWSLKSLQEEVAKCRVLCANHHHKHTIQQSGYKKWPVED